MDVRLVAADGSTPGSTTLTRIVAGHYRAYVLVNSTDTPQPVSFSGNFAVGSVTKNFGGVVDLDYAVVADMATSADIADLQSHGDANWMTPTGIVT